jgi:hypothetical protein
LYPLKYGGREKELGEGRAAMAFLVEKGDILWRYPRYSSHIITRNGQRTARVEVDF